MKNTRRRWSPRPAECTNHFTDGSKIFPKSEFNGSKGAKENDDRQTERQRGPGESVGAIETC